MILIHKVLHKALHKVLQKNQKFIMSKRKPKQMAMTQKSTQSTQDSCFSWSSVSQEIDIKGEKRELSDDEEEPWWESFKSQSTQKSTQENKLQEFKSSQPKAEASSLQDDNK